MMMGTSRQTFQTPWQARMVPIHSRADVRQTASLKEELYWYRLRAWVAPAGHGSGGQREPVAIEQADISGPTDGVVATDYQFMATYSPANVYTPVSYSWSPEPETGQGTSAATYQWASEGSPQVQVTITDGQGNQAQASHSIAIAVPLNSATISGDTTGNIGTEYQFTATVDPTDATTPLTYSWSPEPKAGQGTATATYEWASTGQQTISVTVSNVAGSVQDSHQIDINAASSLLTGLVAYWKLDETSGTRFDSAGTNHLADNGSVGYGIGKQGNAAEFDGSNSLDAGTLLQPSGNFTFSCWLNPDTLNGNAVAANWTDSSNRAWAIDTFNGPLRFYVYGPSDSVVLDTGITPSTTAWSLVIVWLDTTANKVYCQINNNATLYEANFSGLLYQAGEFTVGRRANLFYDGLIDEVGLWNRVLTPIERTQLYNGSAGLTYPF